MEKKMNAKDVGLRMEGMSEMAEWQRRAEKVKIDKDLLGFRLELGEISNRFEKWEYKVPLDYINRTGSVIEDMSALLWKVDECLASLMREKIEYDIMNSRD